MRKKKRKNKKPYVTYWRESQKKRDRVRELVYGKTTPGSPGDYILMKKDLTIRERKTRDFTGEVWYDRVKFTTQWLEKKKLEGDLICVFCGKPHLVIFPYWQAEKDIKIMATADHFIPVSSGLIDYYTEEILVVSCESCNNKKGSKYVDPELIVFCRDGEYDHIKEFIKSLSLQFPNHQPHLFPSAQSDH